MFGEWGADGVKVDHMCQGASCGGGEQGHQMAVDTQGPTMQRWAAAIAAMNKTDSVLFQNCGVGCSPANGDPGPNGQPWAEFCTTTANMWRSGPVSSTAPPPLYNAKMWRKVHFARV